MAKQSKERSWVRLYGPTVVFCCLTLGGCIFIWVSKSVGWNPYYVTGAPVALMVLYFIVSLVADGLRLHDEQTGDNLYYMGFLFTLTSLGATLYQYTSSNSIEDIVRNFGVAITSTIAGIGLRIFYNQMRRDPLDVERAARHELASSARRVRAEMDAASQEFSVYRRTSNQMLQEGFEEIARQAQATGKLIKAAFENLSHEAIAPLQTTSASLNKVIEGNSKAFDSLLKDELGQVKATASELSSLSAGLVVSMADLNKQIAAASKKLRNIKSPEEVIKLEIEPILGSVTQATVRHIDEMTKLSEQQRDEFATVLQEVSAYRQLIPQIERMVGLIERSVVAIENQTRPGRGYSEPIFQPGYSTEHRESQPPADPWPPDERRPPFDLEPSPEPRKSIWRPWR